MIAKKAVSLMALFAMLLVMAAPAAAAEKSFDIKIPGCTA